MAAPLWLERVRGAPEAPLEAESDRESLAPSVADDGVLSAGRLARLGKELRPRS